MIRASLVVLLGVSAVGCASSGDLRSLDGRLENIELEVLRLRKEGPSKTEVADLEAAITAKIDELLHVDGDVSSGLAELARLVEELRAKLDDTNFRIAQVSQQIAATNQELQAVRNAAEVARAVKPPPPSSSSANPADPQSLYDTAYNDYVRGNYDLAILSFHQYLDAFPSTELADNATYWIGECYYLQGKFQKAIEQFDKVLSDYVDSDRSPSALLKKGFAYIGLGQKGQGVVQLQKVLCEFSGTDEAHLARQRLQEMGIDADC